MPLMYHKDASEPVNVSIGCVDTMKNRGWELRDEQFQDEPDNEGVIEQDSISEVNQE